MPALVANTLPVDYLLVLTEPVPAGRMIRIDDVCIRVYDCTGRGPYWARLGFGYCQEGQEKYYPVPIGACYPAGTPVQLEDE